MEAIEEKVLGLSWPADGICTEKGAGGKEKEDITEWKKNLRKTTVVGKTTESLSYNLNVILLKNMNEIDRGPNVRGFGHPIYWNLAGHKRVGGNFQCAE